MILFMERMRADLSTLSKPAQFLFGILTAEALLPCYEKFERDLSWGNSTLLRDGIDTAYISLLHPTSFTESEICEKLAALDHVIPLTEDFESILTSFALDAGCAVECLLNFVLNNDSECIVDICSFAYDTVDRFILNVRDLPANDKHLESKIDGDPFMIQEKLRQTNLILALRNVSVINEAVLNKVRTKDPLVNLDIL